MFFRGFPFTVVIPDPNNYGSVNQSIVLMQIKAFGWFYYEQYNEQSVNKILMIKLVPLDGIAIFTEFLCVFKGFIIFWNREILIFYWKKNFVYIMTGFYKNNDF